MIVPSRLQSIVIQVPELATGFREATQLSCRRFNCPDSHTEVLSGRHARFTKLMPPSCPAGVSLPYSVHRKLDAVISWHWCCCPRLPIIQLKASCNGLMHHVVRSSVGSSWSRLQISGAMLHEHKRRFGIDRNPQAGLTDDRAHSYKSLATLISKAVNAI
jgi:hypothetical protein